MGSHISLHVKAMVRWYGIYIPLGEQDRQASLFGRNTLRHCTLKNASVASSKVFVHPSAGKFAWYEQATVRVDWKERWLLNKMKARRRKVTYTDELRSVEARALYKVYHARE